MTAVARAGRPQIHSWIALRGKFAADLKAPKGTSSGGGQKVGRSAPRIGRACVLKGIRDWISVHAHLFATPRLAQQWPESGTNTPVAIEASNIQVGGSERAYQTRGHAERPGGIGATE